MTKGKGPIVHLRRAEGRAANFAPEVLAATQGIPHHPGRVRKSLFATSSGVPERHEDVISDGGFPRLSEV